MKKFPFLLFSLLLSVFLTPALKAQHLQLSGTILDASSGRAIPFATVTLKKRLIGVVANENGEFDLYVPESPYPDTLIVNGFGYRRQMIPLAQVKTPLQVRLAPEALEIEEVRVIPRPPEFYIREAMRRISDNYPSAPFATIAYYREKMLENKEFVQSDECIFRTFYPKYTDTVRNQDQLMLYRRAENLRELAFMSREREKEGKQEEKAYKKKGKSDTAHKKESAPIATSFGGPQGILGLSKVNNRSWGFLDTNKLASYSYSFAQQSSYNGSSLMVISFSTRKKVNHMRETGKVYIDPRNFAVVKIEDAGDFVVPVWIRPVLFMAGLSIKDPWFTRHMEFGEAGGRWYPQQIRFHVDVKLTKRYWFSPNDHSHLEIDHVFAVNTLELEKPVPVPPAKRFDHRKEMNGQVHNDENLSWTQLNVVKD